MSYAYLGAEPEEPQSPEPPEPRGGLPSDVAPTLLHEVTVPVPRRRGWVAVPTRDVREFVQTQLLVAAAGFTAGVGIGALFGNVLASRKLTPMLTKVIRNPRRRRRRRTRRNAKRRTSRRRTSTRRRRRGRPGGHVVNEGAMVLTMEGQPVHVRVERGNVIRAGRRYGSVFDMGTYFRAVPRRGGDARSYGTLAGAVKHVLRFGRAA